MHMIFKIIVHKSGIPPICTLVLTNNISDQKTLHGHKTFEIYRSNDLFGSKSL